MEIQKESEDQDTSRGMITSIDTVTQVSIKFPKKKNTKNMVMNIEQNTNHTYENGDTCVRLWQKTEMRMHACLDTQSQELE